MSLGNWLVGPNEESCEIENERGQCSVILGNRRMVLEWKDSTLAARMIRGRIMILCNHDDFSSVIACRFIVFLS